MESKLEILNSVKSILNGVIDEINIGKSKIFNIADRMRDEIEEKKKELREIKQNIILVIDEVDILERLDKNMRLRLVEESKKIKTEEKDFQKFYEEALDLRVKYITKQNQEKDLIIRRDNLERNLINYKKNIEEADVAVNQINVALGYLQGKLLNDVDEENKNIETSLAIKVLENQEQDRKRIARDIHDGPTQFLANAMMRIDFCKIVLEKDLCKGLKELDDVKVNVKMALKEVRGIIYDLRPSSLEELGLYDAIKEMAKNITDENNMNLKLGLEGDLSDFQKIRQTTVYRIVQEILNNIKRHSKAKNINIRLVYLNGVMCINVEDDGQGFKFDETIKKIKKDGNRFGLLGLLERITQFQGRFKIDSLEGMGTKYIITIPKGKRE
ncbi:sensor histidine kinase [Clostridium sp.]|uniref:sensor histidine kinase n=1 Tax=Clostridium sp. TaxID=1506 RepID=UPI00262A7BF6|nr:sensor histidine kinase [Clostridium sp.]